MSEKKTRDGKKPEEPETKRKEETADTKKVQDKKVEEKQDEKRKTIETCNQCELGFERKNELIEHRREHEKKSDQFNGYICGIQDQTNGAHKKATCEQCNFNCTWCDFQGNSNMSLIEYMKTVHEQKDWSLSVYKSDRHKRKKKACKI